MVDSVHQTTSGPNALIRAQHIANAANAQKTTQTINQTRSAAVVPVKAQAVPQSVKLAGTSSEKILPRGSLVDTVV